MSTHVFTAYDFEKIYSLIDLTSLNEGDTEENLIPFFKKAESVFGHVAAVCIYPKFVRLAKTFFLNTPVKVATVINFPKGTSSIETVLIEINQALQDGAQEMDVVFPYLRYLEGDKKYARSFVAACRAASSDDILLKVILETGALQDPALISEACWDVFSAGADFVKTSTGKMETGATRSAAEAMLSVIKEKSMHSQKRLGLKISGGIRDVQQAAQYIELAQTIMGKEWVTKDTFRIGASKLVDEILAFD